MDQKTYAQADVSDIVVEDLMIPSDTAGISLHLRNKRQAMHTTFSSERTILMMHGATYSSESLFDAPLGGISFIPTPGHSIDHASIRLVSRGEQALFAGDVMHHPLQVYEPSLNSCFCEFPEAALRSRAAVLKDAAERGATVFTTHFAQSSVGRIDRRGDRFAWHFL